MSQRLTCSVVRGEDSFDAVLRKVIRLSALKAASNLVEEVWWCLAWFLLQKKTRSLVRLYDKINASVYRDILKKHIVPNLRTIIIQPAVFMQDNATCHTVKTIKTFLSEAVLTVMECPAQSPDTNPFVNVWKLLNERDKKKNPRNVEELSTNMKGEWVKISVDECKTLILSCSKKMSTCYW